MVSFLRIAILSFIVLTITAPHLASASARGRWWRSDQVVSQLQLTEEEVRQLDALYDAAHVRMIELRGELKTAQLALRMLMTQADLDEAALSVQRQREKAVRARISDERFAFLLEVRKLMGHDRFKQMMEIRDAQRRQRHKRSSGDSVK